MAYIQIPPVKYDFESRWSPAIARRGFAGIPSCLYTCQSTFGITSMEMNVLGQLIALRYTPKNPYASMKLLANRIGKSEKSVRAAISSLEKKGLITRVYSKGRPSTFNFAPLVHKLESHDCSNPARKGSYYRTKSSEPPRTITTAKEGSYKNTYKRKGGVNSIGEIMANGIHHRKSLNNNDVQ